MLTKSQAGEFEVNIARFEREGDDLVLVGTVGVWEARTHITPREVVKTLCALLTSGAVWLYVCRLPFLLLKRR